MVSGWSVVKGLVGWLVGRVKWLDSARQSSCRQEQGWSPADAIDRLRPWRVMQLHLVRHAKTLAVAFAFDTVISATHAFLSTRPPLLHISQDDHDNTVIRRTSIHIRQDVGVVVFPGARIPRGPAAADAQEAV